MKIALYKDTDWEYYSPQLFEVTANMENHGSYVRTSIISEVDLSALPDTVVNNEIVKRLDMQMDKLRAETLEKLAELEIKKQELLALTFQSNDDA